MNGAYQRREFNLNQNMGDANRIYCLRASVWDLHKRMKLFLVTA